VTPEEFVDLHPQFAQCSTTMISSALVAALDAVSEDELGDSYQQAYEMQVCHILAIEMYGQQASIKGGETTQYEIKFKELIRRKVAGGLVT
jgi:hypothetical protein